MSLSGPVRPGCRSRNGLQLAFEEVRDKDGQTRVLGEPVGEDLAVWDPEAKHVRASVVESYTHVRVRQHAVDVP